MSLADLLAGGRGYSAAAAVILREGKLVDSAAFGHTAFAAGSRETGATESGKAAYPARSLMAYAPRATVMPVTGATLFDLASITKVFVAATALKLGPSTLDLDEPVSRWLPSLAAGHRITARQLLTHTSGLPPVLDLVSLPDRESRLEAVFNAHVGDTPFDYSCVGFIVLGLLLEQITGTALSCLVHEEVIGPLGLISTGYLPDAGYEFAATEYQQSLGRGLVQGSVHDETSWALGGVAGNAGIFATAAELARFGEALRCGELLPPDVMTEMTRNHLSMGVDPGYGHGLGVRLNAPFMGPLEGYGHTGFTGTSMVIDPARELVVVLLTNRVHPHRNLSDVEQLRCDVARWASECA